MACVHLLWMLIGGLVLVADVVAGGELGIRGGTPGRRVLGPGNGAPRPYFDDVSPRNVTAIVGQTVVLNCRVKHLGDRMVSIFFTFSC